MHILIICVWKRPKFKKEIPLNILHQVVKTRKKEGEMWSC